VDPGERRQAYVPDGLGPFDGDAEGGGAADVVAGLALRSPEAGQLVGRRLLEAEAH
jgi:hypothetical protein